MLPSSARNPQRQLSTLWMITVCAITVTLLSGSFVTTAFGAPAKLDAIAPPTHTPFPLETQPALFTDAIAAALNSDNDNNNGDGNSGGKGGGGFLNIQKSAIDSYGNPIEALKPIDTPDGRKVISAQGLQFEIPNYASGITEIKKPADDLLPPFIDPIAVAVPNESADGTSTTGTGSTANSGATTVDVENAELVELKPNTDFQSQIDGLQNNGVNSLPEYIIELNDPDIGGPVEYMPAEDGSSLKVIAWDLLPPIKQDSEIVTTDPKNPNNNKASPNAGQNLSTQENLSGVSSVGTVFVNPLTNSNRGNIYFTSSTTTTPRPTIVRTTRPTTTTSTTTTTKATTTTPRTTTTTTRRPTTTTTRRPTTTTTTFAPLNPDDFYQLEHGDSYTLPTWLADIDDPELDAAVTYIVPENIHEYNDTIARDLLPPLEPYTDLNNIDLPAPSGVLHTTTTTTSRPRTTVMSTSKRPISTTTTTTRQPTVSTTRPHWVRAYPTTVASTTIPTTTTRPNSFDGRFSSNNIAQLHDPKSASSSTLQNVKASTSFLSNSAFSTTTTTQKPHSTTPAHHLSSFNQNLPTTNADPITSTEVETSQAGGKFKISNSNPFLPTRNSASSPFATVNAYKFTTTTTTTTTPATLIEENPFNTATLPSWLTNFDYPDLAPGVPFIYNDENSNSDVFNDLQPPSQLDTQATDTTKPVFITSSPTSFNSFPVSSSSDNRHDSTLASASTIRTFAFNNSPSKVTTTAKPSSIHNPFARGPNNNEKNQEEALTLPPALFNPPTAAGNDVSNINPQTDNINFNTFNHQQQPELQSAASADQIITKIPSSSNFNTNFAAPFETTTVSGSIDTAISTDPDFGSSTKTTFTKSNEGKVITNNIFGAASSVTAPSKQFGFSTSTSAGQTTVQKGFQHSASNHFLSSTHSFSGTSSTFNKASTPSGFPTFTSTQQSTSFGSLNNKGVELSAANVGAGKYTGSFGGSPGVLGNGKLGYAVQQADGSIRSPSNGQAAVSVATAASTLPNPVFANRAGVSAAVGINKFQGSFGGPPGVLAPFDNVKSG